MRGSEIRHFPVDSVSERLKDYGRCEIDTFPKVVSGTEITKEGLKGEGLNTSLFICFQLCSLLRFISDPFIFIDITVKILILVRILLCPKYFCR